MISFRSIFEAKGKEEEVPLTGNTTLDVALSTLRQQTVRPMIVNPKIITNLNTIVTLPSGEPIRALLRRLTHLKIIPESEEKGTVVEEVKVTFVSVSPLLRFEILGLSGKYVLGNLPETLKEVRVDNVEQTVAEEILFSDLKEWKSLETLYVTRCNLFEIKKGSFTPTNFPRLKFLDVSNNNLTCLENIGERPLDVFVGNNNRIENVNCQIVGSISSISLDNNKITTLCPFGVFLQLRTISFKNNLIEDLDNVKEAFSRLYNLTSVSLDGNKLCDSKIYHIQLAAYLPSTGFGISVKIDDKIVSPLDVAEFLKHVPKKKEVVKIVKQEITDKDVEEYIRAKMESVLNAKGEDEKVFQTRNFLQNIYEIVSKINTTIDPNDIQLNELINK
ncbi:hypothetical protein EIN_083780 [Entamoeba invadens IP1]|uniref:hypothetical protein n=1 Tax=Entamoeba invadens IP1 TaxID=370355 RepID=UPI0002C3D9F5|nr:hypothetical protein EIN_083780 [Entamoeba invadens IP1]ELP85236.1 hypothetical protein EIN_083780 [Entamoeba invadens IP1]|eukprot:XP_004184582.1 hypothetical protein EIN_083780 [Entamoeba invadens IP1]